jgi:sugar-specific transcriptional regulator TrmB
MEPILGQIGGFLEKFGVHIDDPLIYAAYDKILLGLQELGLALKEAKILIFLIIRKQSTAADISRYNDIGRTETYNHITNLMSKGMVFSNFDRPQKYYALPLDKAIDHLIEARRGTLQRLSESKTEYCRMLEQVSQNLTLSAVEEKNSYQILSGKNSLSSTVKRMVLDAKEELVMLLNEKTFVDFYHAGTIDDVVKLAKKGIAVRLQTSCRNTQEYIGTGQGNITINTIEDKMVNFVLVDSRDIVVMLLGKTEKAKLHGFYTNNLPIISVFKTFFENTK